MPSIGLRDANPRSHQCLKFHMRLLSTLSSSSLKRNSTTCLQLSESMLGKHSSALPLTQKSPEPCLRLSQRNGVELGEGCSEPPAALPGDGHHELECLQDGGARRDLRVLLRHNPV